MSAEVLTEVVIAVAIALSEQLDTERLLAALKRQHDLYERHEEPNAKAIAQHLRKIGSALNQVQDLREKRRGPEH